MNSISETCLLKKGVLYSKNELFIPNVNLMCCFAVVFFVTKMKWGLIVDVSFNMFHSQEK